MHVSSFAYVSIHAPTQGATWLVLSRGHSQNSFNPRTHTGCDYLRLLRDILDNKFQSTHPHRVRHISAPLLLAELGFNPRTHTGCDVYYIYGIKIYQRFNPRTHTGCDRTSPPTPCVSLSFNPRTHTGCDVYKLEDNVKNKKFQSTHPHRVRPLTAGAAMPPACFNPRTHTGCDNAAL